ncbi:D-arabinose 1-dehydrogenase-like Zn-dependent alcohol dehydrogenase [Ensifer sp. 4252]
MKAVVMNEIGGTDVMAYVDLPDPVATPGHVVVEVAAAGVNFMDIGVRQGMAWTDRPNPKILGVEGDVATASFLENWIDDGEQRIWFLFEILRGTNA